MLIRLLKGYRFLSESREVFLTSIFNVEINTPWFSLDLDGRLLIQKNYAWDGPSKPAIRTKNFLIPSLVHDAFYQAMREGHLPRSRRKAVDEELRRMCLRWKMNKFRAWYVYHWCRLFAGHTAKPRKNPRGKIIEVSLKLWLLTKS